MTQEEKQLLLMDLCARLPYGVKCKIRYTFNNETTFGEDVEAEEDDVLVKIDMQSKSAYFDWYGDFISIEDAKPYLRLMSSMTDEEYKEYDKATDLDVADSAETLRENLKAKTRVRISKCYHGTDWLNAHHFDYRGLIPMGLALEASEEMYRGDKKHRLSVADKHNVEVLFGEEY